MNAMRLTHLGLGLTMVVLLALAACTRSNFPSWSSPQRVSTEAGSNDSDMPAIFSDSGDNVVVAWSSEPTSSDSEIYWRRYNSLGAPQTAAIPLTNNAYGDYYPSVGMSNGITYLAWMGDEISSSNIYWGAVDQNGDFVAGPQVISDLTYNDYDPHLIQCGDYSHVFWSGDSASYDFEIYYAKIRYNGIIEVPYKRLINSPRPQYSPRGEVDASCSRLYIAYEHEYSLTDTDVGLVGINTSDGSTVFGPTPLALSSAKEDQIDIAVSAPLSGTTTLVSVVWRRDDGAGGEIYYASRDGNGALCAPNTAVTNDSQSDGQPRVENVEWNSVKYAVVVWERVETGTGSDRDIYMKFFRDDCAPSPSSSATLISEASASATDHDVYPQIRARLSPDGVPIYAIMWRTLADGAVWSRFGSILGPTGPSEKISDASSAGYPGGERPGPAAALGQQFYVAWVGNNPGTAETWYQQTVWRVLLPVVLKE